MTFYILDHGPPTPPFNGEKWQRYTWVGPCEAVSLGGQTVPLATRPTQRAAEELVELLRNQEKERGR